MHVAPKEAFTSKMEQNESFLRYKKKEWLKFGTWMGKSYKEIWNVVAVPNSYHRARPCNELSRKEFFFCQNEFLYNVQHTEQKKMCTVHLKKFHFKNIGTK